MLKLTVEVMPRGADVLQRHTVVIEIIGRQANVILVDDNGKVRDALRRKRGYRRSRHLAPRATYEPPALVPGFLPTLVQPAAMANLAAPETPAWRVVVGAATAVSPTLAREALARADVEPETASSHV